MEYNIPNYVLHVKSTETKDSCVLVMLEWAFYQQKLCRDATGSQNGQTKCWRWRAPFMFFSSQGEGAARGISVVVICNLTTGCLTILHTGSLNIRWQYRELKPIWHTECAGVSFCFPAILHTTTTKKDSWICVCMSHVHGRKPHVLVTCEMQIHM